MRIDTHTHTGGVSFCSEVSVEDYVRLYKAAGYQAVILSNHYTRHYMFRYGETWEQQIKVYIDEYRKAKKLGEAVGLNVLLSAEVSLPTEPGTCKEFLLYGIDEAFLSENPCLYDKSQAELYKICHDNNVLMFQAHPFRHEGGSTPQDPTLMDGIEFNCHPYYERHEQEVRDFADKNNLMLICGSDLHYDYQAGSAATIVPDDITDAKAFADYLRKNRRPELWYK